MIHNCYHFVICFMWASFSTGHLNNGVMVSQGSHSYGSYFLEYSLMAEFQLLQQQRLPGKHFWINMFYEMNYTPRNRYKSNVSTHYLSFVINVLLTFRHLLYPCLLFSPHMVGRSVHPAGSIPGRGLQVINHLFLKERLISFLMIWLCEVDFWSLRWLARFRI